MMPRFRRPILPPRRRFPLPYRRPIRRRAAKIALERLRTAHTLLAQGKPKEAAAIFIELADAALQRGIPRAAQLNLQAGGALIAAKEIESGLDRIRQGLTLMADTNQVTRLPNAGRRIIEELRNQGLTNEAAAIESEIQTLLSKHGLTLAAAAGATNKQSLPAKCPYCGGNVHPDEVEWINQQQAMCSYCGSHLAGNA
jgi:hypothetical protein